MSRALRQLHTPSGLWLLATLLAIWIISFAAVVTLAAERSTSIYSSLFRTDDSFPFNRPK
jgi:hypothetical protein